VNAFVNIDKNTNENMIKIQLFSTDFFLIKYDLHNYKKLYECSK
jgi:hypothetical protein